MTKWKMVALAVVLVVALAAGIALGATLGGEDVGTGDAVSPTDSTVVDETDTDSLPQSSGTNEGTATTHPASRPTDCSLVAGQPFVGGPAVEVVDIGESNGVQVQGVRYPRPDYEGDPWTQWGQGLLHEGKFYSAIGDHIGVDGNSYLFEYDPSTGTLSTLGDVLSYVDHEPGSWGYGKVHGQLVPGPCGEIYFATYWGTNRDIRFDGSYRGDALFRLDPTSRTITFLGVPVEEHGIPSLAGSPDGRFVYGEAIDPILEIDDVDSGPFFAYDTMAEQVVFVGDPEPHEGFRNIMVDLKGRAYYAVGGSRLAVYDPTTNTVSDHPSSMPGDWLRASTTPAPDGTIFGVTDDEAAMFVMHPSGDIESLGTARGYTTSLAIHPDGASFFYVPDAHGSAWEEGAPLIRVDGLTGEETVVVELNAMAEENLGLRLGGTYGLAVDPTGETVYIGMNAGPLGAEDGFGEIVLLVVHLP